MDLTKDEIYTLIQGLSSLVSNQRERMQTIRAFKHECQIPQIGQGYTDNANVFALEDAAIQRIDARIQELDALISKLYQSCNCQNNKY